MPEPQHLISCYYNASLVIYIHTHSLKTTPVKWDQPPCATELVLLHPHSWTTPGLLEAQPVLHAARNWLSLEIVPLWITWKIIHTSWACWSRDSSSGKPFGKISVHFAHLSVLASAFQQRCCRCSCKGQQSQFNTIGVNPWSDEKFIFYEREFMLEFRLTHLAKTRTVPPLLRGDRRLLFRSCDGVEEARTDPFRRKRPVDLFCIARQTLCFPICWQNTFSHEIYHSASFLYHSGGPKVVVYLWMATDTLKFCEWQAPCL